MGDHYSKILPELYDDFNNAGIVIGTGDYYIKPEILNDFNIDAIICCLNGNILEYKQIYTREINKKCKTEYSVDSSEINNFFFVLSS